MRGIRPIECALEDRKDSEAEVIRGYCTAVRSALSDDGRPPLVASGLKLQARLSAIAGSLDRITGQGNEQGGEQATEQGRGGRELQRLRAILNRGLAETQSLWPDIRSAYGWVHQAACILDNPTKLDDRGVKRRLCGLLGAMKRHRSKAGELTPAVDHFLKVSRSYWPGLFYCYRVPGLPKTNNDLEQFFGSHRYYERRATGRKTASPGLVLRGSVRIVAAAATRVTTSTIPVGFGVSCQAWNWTIQKPGKSHSKHSWGSLPLATGEPRVARVAAFTCAACWLIR